MGLFNKKSKGADGNTSKFAALKVSVSNEGAEYTFTVEGRLDTNTSPELEAKINEVIGNANKLIIDLGDLEGSLMIPGHHVNEDLAKIGGDQNTDIVL